MNTEAKRTRFRLPLLAGLFLVAATFAGSASINDRSLATRATPFGAKVLPRSAANEATADPSVARAAAEGMARPGLAHDPAVRARLRCPDCGWVESIRRIDRLHFAGGACSIADVDSSRIADSANHGSEYVNLAILFATIDSVLARRRDDSAMKVTSRYQIVVRFRDGSRHVFYETTGRALQSGQRVLVIAGADLPAL